MGSHTDGITNNCTEQKQDFKAPTTISDEICVICENNSKGYIENIITPKMIRERFKFTGNVFEWLYYHTPLVL